ncbi:MAG: hypothetical protein ACKOOH_02975 [Cyanobium sp.]
MLTPSTRLRLQAILDRIESDQPVTLQDRIYVQKFADRDQGVAAWLLQARRRQLQQSAVERTPKDGIDQLLRTQPGAPPNQPSISSSPGR